MNRINLITLGVSNMKKLLKFYWDGLGFTGINLAINFKSKQSVDDFIKRAVVAGANIIKQPQLVFWSGYSGYYWEVAYSKDWKFDQNGMLIIE